MALIDYIIRSRQQGNGAEDAAKDMERLDRATQKVNRSARQATGSVGGLGNALKLGGAVAVFNQLGNMVTGLARQIPRMALDMVAYGDQLGKFADRVGVSSELLQEFRFAAQQTGVEAGTADLALQRFARRFGEAAQGTGELLPVLEQYGIAVRNQDGTTRDIAAVLGDFAEVIKNVKDPTERLRIAFKGFDSEGAALVNTLSGGKEGLQGYFDELERLGGVVTDDDIARLEELNNVLGRINAQVQSKGATWVSRIADFLDIGQTQQETNFEDYIAANQDRLERSARTVTGGRGISPFRKYGYAAVNYANRRLGGFFPTAGRDLLYGGDVGQIMQRQARSELERKAAEVNSGEWSLVNPDGNSALQDTINRQRAEAEASAPPAAAPAAQASPDELLRRLLDVTGGSLQNLRDSMGPPGLAPTPGDTLAQARQGARSSSARLITAAENAASALADGADAGELEALREALEKLGAAAVTKTAKQEAQIQLLTTRTEQLAQQLAGSRQ